VTLGDIAPVMTAIGTLVAAFGSIGGVWVSLRNSRKVDTVVEKVDAIHEATNGLVTKLSDAKQAQGEAEGHAKGLEQGRSEQDKIP
jgi:hypothetical protein